VADGTTDRRPGPLSALGRSEVRRRLVHVAGALVPMAYVAGLVDWRTFQLVYLAAFVGAGVLEFLRLVVGLDWWVFRELTREYESSNLAGYFLFVLGSAVAVFLFPRQVAVPALLMLSIVDPVSGLLADNEFREPKRPAVLVVAFALSAFIALPFLWPSLVAILLGAATTTVADGMTPVVRGHAIDDNLTIPIGAGAAMWVGLQLPV